MSERWVELTERDTGGKDLGEFDRSPYNPTSAIVPGLSMAQGYADTINQCRGAAGAGGRHRVRQGHGEAITTRHSVGPPGHCAVSRGGAAQRAERCSWA
jgi:hypothetical protein